MSNQQQYHNQQQQQQLTPAQAQALAIQQSQRGAYRSGSGTPQQRQAPVQPSQPQVQAPPNLVGEHIPIGDGNDGLRSAKRRKPTDRSLPTFMPRATAPTLEGPTAKRLEESTQSLQSMSSSYARLQQVERKLDWTISRKKVELSETLGGQRLPGVKRTLRLHLVTKLHDQPWQVPLEHITAPPLSDAPIPEPIVAAPAVPVIPDDIVIGDIDISVDGPSASMAVEAPEEVKVEPTPVEVVVPSVTQAQDAPGVEPVLPPDFKKGTGIPRFELFLTGELLVKDGKDLVPSKEKTFAGCIQRVVFESDRDPKLYGQTGPIGWTRTLSTPSDLPGISLSLPTSVTTHIRLSLYLDQTPDVFGLAPDLATLLDMHEGDRVTILQALWSYIKMHGLQDEDKKHIRPDARTKKIFSGQEKVPFHHLPEYVNRFLIPPAPVALDYIVQVNEAVGDTVHAIFDVDIRVEDPVRAEIQQVQSSLDLASEEIKEIISLDEQIASSALLIKQSHPKRNFLTSFATNPHSFISTWLSSQSHDLSLILGTEAGSQTSVGGGATWREEIRKADVWREEWVKEGAALHTARGTEMRLREMTAAQGAQRVPSGRR